MNKFRIVLVLGFSLLVNSILAIPDTIQQKINYYISQAEFDSAKNYIESKLLDTSLNDNSASLNYQLVKVLFIQSDYEEALKISFKTLDQIDDDIEQGAKFNFMIACIYSAIKDYTKSIEYFDQVVSQSTDSSMVVKAHLLSSELHLELKDSTYAKQSLESAYNITKHSNLNSSLKNHVSIQYNYHNHNYEECKKQNLVIINDTTSFVNAKSYALSMVGDCLIKQDSLLKAAEYFTAFLNLTFKTKDPEQVKIAANKLIDVYEKIGDQEKANSYHKIYNEAVNDSLSFSIEKYRDLYNVEKEREINTVKSKTFKNYFLICLAALLLLLVVYVYLNKTRNHDTKTASIDDKTPTKKITISEVEIEKIKNSITLLIENQLYLTSKITRKSFCVDHNIKSERYLSHYINSEYKTSFTVFINDLRIEYAYNRIKDDPIFRNYRIEEIAKASGFGSKKSFERAFAAKYNETPYKLVSRLTN